jgi:hypothetical protein
LRAVAENVYARVLAQLVQAEGSAQAVARRLRAPEKTMERWLQGRAQMPLRAFLEALKLVVDHEVRDGPLCGAQHAPERLTFKAGPVVAECPKCRSTQFRRADADAPLTYRSRLACLRCEGEIVHGDLVVALTREVARRAGSYVARAKAQRTRRKLSAE